MTHESFHRESQSAEAGIGDDGTGAIETRKGNTPIKVWVTRQ